MFSNLGLVWLAFPVPLGLSKADFARVLLRFAMISWLCGPPSSKFSSLHIRCYSLTDTTSTHHVMKSLLLVVASIALTQCFSSVPSCSSDKAELTGERLQTLIELNKGLSANKTSTTFNLDWFLSRLAPLFTPDISYHVPLGVGHLVGLNDVAEYLALSFSSARKR